MHQDESKMNCIKFHNKFKFPVRINKASIERERLHWLNLSTFAKTNKFKSQGKVGIPKSQNRKWTQNMFYVFQGLSWL